MSNDHHRYPPRGPAPTPARLADRLYRDLAMALYCLLSVVVIGWSLVDRFKAQVRVVQLEEQLATCQQDAAPHRQLVPDPTR
ncbi:hypothetical protein L6R53_25790 [Myxococcota bacterium]|nr:hypothetical protein [Myxococcota bacterium]